MNRDFDKETLKEILENIDFSGVTGVMAIFCRHGAIICHNSGGSGAK